MTETPATRAQAADDARVYPHGADYFGRQHEYADARDEYREKTRAVKEEFAAELGRTFLAISSDRVRGAVFDRAWEDGHSSGYFTVQDIYEDLAEIVNLAIADTWRTVKRS